MRAFSLIAWLQFFIELATVVQAANVSSIALSNTLTTPRTSSSAIAQRASSSRASSSFPKASFSTGTAFNATTVGADACQASFVSWSALTTSIKSPYLVTYTSTVTYKISSDLSYGVADVYTTIDGFAHAHGNMNYTVTLPLRIYSRDTYTDSSVTTPAARSNATLPPSPTCTFDYSGCYSLHSVFTSSYIAQYSTYPPVSFFSAPSNSARCAVGNPDCAVTYSTAPCTVLANTVQLFYWPRDNSTITRPQVRNGTIAPRTAVVGNLTMTSPSIYLSFDKISARATSYTLYPAASCGKPQEWQFPVGTSLSNAVISIAPKDVSTLEVGQGYYTDPFLEKGFTTAYPDAAIAALASPNASDYKSWVQDIYGINGNVLVSSQINVDDLTRPNPRAYYLAVANNYQRNTAPFRPGCYADGPHLQCNTIFDDIYRAQISIPPPLLNLEPEWRTCLPELFGVYDPPQALTATNVADVATVATTIIDPTTTVAASPSQQPAAPTVPATSQAVPTTIQALSELDPAKTTPVEFTMHTEKSVETADPTLSRADVPASSGHIENSVPAIASPSRVNGLTTDTQAALPETVASPQIVPFTTQAAPSNALQALTQDPGAAPAAVITADGSALTVSSISGNAVVGGITVSAGGALTVGSVVISNVQSGVAVATATPQPAVATVGDQTLAPAVSGGGVVVGGSTTLTPGQVTVISGSTISVGSSAVVVAGSTVSLADPTLGAVTTIGGQIISPTSTGGGIVIGSSTTLIPGQVTTISGTVISVGTSVVAIGSTTLTLVADPTQNAVATVAGQIVAPATSGGVIIGSKTLPPGQVTTISGTVISAGSSVVVVDGSTINLATPTSQSIIATVAGQTIAQATSGSGVVVGDTSLSPGQVTTIGRTIISAGTSIVVIGSSTVALTNPTLQGVVQEPGTTFQAGVGVLTLSGGSVEVDIGSLKLTVPSSALVQVTSAGVHTTTIVEVSRPSISVAGSVITEASNGDFVVASQTLKPGGSPAIISGTTYSVGPSDSYLVVNGKTTTLAQATTRTITVTYSIASRTTTTRPTATNQSSQVYQGSGVILSPRSWFAMLASAILLLVLS